MAKLEEIAYELSKLWNYHTREELCEYFNISDRTLYRYQSKLELNKVTQKPIKAKNSLSVYLNTKDNKVKKQDFKSWLHFVAWSKAQPHPYRISDGNVINIDYSKLTEDAKNFLKSL